MKRLHMISGPRNISTAMMYSFGNRSDTTIVDEPFYAYYLLSHGYDHPGREETIDSMPSKLTEVLEKTLFAYCEKPIVFFKDMAHHLVDVDSTNILELDNFFLIRDLKKLIFSFSKVIPKPSLLDIGIKQEYELYRFLEEHDIHAPIIDTDQFLTSPKKNLEILCSRLLIPFDEKMLHWPKGPRKEDGIWAKYWYSNVHKSSEFVPITNREEINLKDHLLDLYQEAMPYYEYLHKRIIK